MSLETQTKKIMSAAIERYAEEEKVDTNQVQLLIYTDNPDCEPRYKVLIHNKPLKDVSFNEILNVKIDFSYSFYRKFLKKADKRNKM